MGDGEFIVKEVGREWEANSKSGERRAKCNNIVFEKKT